MPKQQKVMEVVRRLPITKKSCPTCGKEFWGPAVRTFCSTSCRNKAAYQRNPETYRENRRKSYRKLKGEAKQ
jgi:hypothetical protein